MTSPRVLLALALAVAVIAPAPLPAQVASTGGEPLRLSLKDCIAAAFKNNKDIRVDSYAPEIAANDLLFQMAQFDANVTASGSYRDASQPTLNLTDAGITGARVTGEVVGFDSTQYALNARYDDRLHIGSFWSADLVLARNTSTSANTLFPESYYSQLEFSFTQPLLKNFGRDINETAITVATNNQDADRQTFRTRVQQSLMEVEAAYWTLVYARQDLQVRKEALGLAQELLKLNQIKVQVGTLPPIDITQAEAGVASREEAVIIAEANIEAAADRLRRVLGMDPQSPEWMRPIEPTDEFVMGDRTPTLDSELPKAIENRPDLATARTRLKNTDADLAYRRNQMKYSLDVNARYLLQGLAGDTSGFRVRDPNTGATIFSQAPNNDPDLWDSMEFIPKTDFPTYEVSLTLGIPIGNRAAESEYTTSRLRKEQASIAYQSYEQLAMVEVGNAVRRVNTDRKRIEAAEKNRILQEKKVEAEQKKFENGLSTSFQVLEFQNDLAEARSAENRAKADYRVSLANLDLVTGTLDTALNVKIEDYQRE